MAANHCAMSVNSKERCVTDNTHGALLMIASMQAFIVNDACIKATNGALPSFQLLFLLGVLSTFLIAVALWWLGHWRLPVPRTDRKLIAQRSLSEIVATMLFLTALFNMPLANVIALLELLLLTVTLVGAMVLGEPVGWRRKGHY